MINLRYKKYVFFLLVMIFSLLDTLITVPGLLLGATEMNQIFHQFFPTHGMLSLLVVDFRNLFVFGFVFLVVDATHHLICKIKKIEGRVYNNSKIMAYAFMAATIIIGLYIPVLINNLNVIIQLLQ